MQNNSDDGRIVGLSDPLCNPILVACVPSDARPESLTLSGYGIGHGKRRWE